MLEGVLVSSVECSKNVIRADLNLERSLTLLDVLGFYSANLDVEDRPLLKKTSVPVELSRHEAHNLVVRAVPAAAILDQCKLPDYIRIIFSEMNPEKSHKLDEMTNEPPTPFPKGAEVFAYWQAENLRIERRVTLLQDLEPDAHAFAIGRNGRKAIRIEYDQVVK